MAIADRLRGLTEEAALEKAAELGHRMHHLPLVSAASGFPVHHCLNCLGILQVRLRAAGAALSNQCPGLPGEPPTKGVPTP